MIAAGCAAPPDSTEQDAETEALVRQYLTDNPDFLLDNPELLERVREAARTRQEQREAEARRVTLDARAGVVIDPQLTPAVGPADASITIIEFSDYQCAPCKASYPEIAEVAAADPDLRFVHKQLPVYGSHSVMAARAATAAHQQGRFAAFHHALMTSTAPLTAGLVETVAAELGLDLAALRADMRDPQVVEYLAAVKDLAEELGINSTPTFIIGDQLVRGGLTVEVLTQLLAEQRVAGD